MALLNLLGTDGNFESVIAPWTFNRCFGVLDANSATVGNKGMLVTSTDASTPSYYTERRVGNIADGKYYLALADVLNTSNAGIDLSLVWRFSNSNVSGILNVVKTGNILKTGVSGTIYTVITPADYIASQSWTASFCGVRVNANNSAVGQAFSVDAIRMYEIDATIAAKVGVDPAYTGENLAALYPYTEPPVIGNLNNLLGTRGDYETLTGLSLSASAAAALDSTTKTQGNNSLKLSIATASGNANAFLSGIFNSLNKASYYILLVDVKCGTGSAGWAYFDYFNGSGYPSKAGNKITSTTGYGTSYLKLSPTELSVAQSAACHCFMSGTTGQYVNFDAMRLYEISKGFYDLIDAHPDFTGENLAALFPYTNGSGYVPSIKTWTSSDKLNAADMNAIEQNASNIASYLRSLNYSIPALSFTTNRSATTIETFASLNRFEAAVLTIRDSFGLTPPGFRPRRTWDVTQRISFDDPNRWQTNLQALFDAAASVEKSFIYCGTISTGQTWAIRAG